MKCNFSHVLAKFFIHSIDIFYRNLSLKSLKIEEEQKKKKPQSIK